MADQADGAGNAGALAYGVGGYRNAPGVSATPAGTAPPVPGSYSAPSGSVTVNTEDLQRAANQFGSLSSQITQLNGTLTQTLNGNAEGGNPWGNDSIGQSFGQQYVPASQTALQALQGLAQLFSSISSTLGQTAQTYDQTGDANNDIANAAL
jgi:uncharacterized protein YukE